MGRRGTPAWKETGRIGGVRDNSNGLGTGVIDMEKGKAGAATEAGTTKLLVSLHSYV